MVPCFANDASEGRRSPVQIGHLDSLLCAAAMGRHFLELTGVARSDASLRRGTVDVVWHDDDYRALIFKHGPVVLLPVRVVLSRGGTIRLPEGQA